MASDNSEQNLGDDGTVTLRPVSALVPEQVSRGVFSTGVIAITGNTEFILDFVLVVGMPSTVVARVICAHESLRRIVAAIRRNVDAYSVRVAPPGDFSPGVGGPSNLTEPRVEEGHMSDTIATEQFVGASIPVADDAVGLGQTAGAVSGENAAAAESNDNKQNPLNLYDDIVVPDEVQVGVYANGLIIGHTNSEFKLDFVSNMFPKSVVTSRIFMSAPQLVRLLDTLERTLQQFDEKHES